MSNQLAVIEKKLQSKEVTNQLALALDIDLNDEKAVGETKKYVSSVLAEVKRSQGTGNYTDLTTATPDSIVMAMIDAANFKMQIDGRKLCYLEKRGNKVGLQITTNGFTAKIKEHYPDAVFTMTPVFKGDTPPVITEKDGNKSYVFESKNPFGTPEDMLGVLVSISYTNSGGRQVQDAQAVPIADLKKMQAQSKSQAWGSYTIERMKTAALKRACKWHFRQDATIQNLINYDNTENYDLNQPATPVRNSIVDNINQSVNEEQPTTEPQETPQGDEDVIEGDYSTVEEEPPTTPVNEEYAKQLMQDGEAAANRGWHDYKAWVGELSEDDKDIVRDNHAGWTETAREVTRAQQAAAEQEPPQNDEPQGVDNDAPPI